MIKPTARKWVFSPGGLLMIVGGLSLIPIFWPEDSFWNASPTAQRSEAAQYRYWHLFSGDLWHSEERATIPENEELPEITVSEESGALKITTDGEFNLDFDHSLRWYDPTSQFQANQQGVAELPDGTTVRLKRYALWLPSREAWNGWEAEKRFFEEELIWRTLDGEESVEPFSLPREHSFPIGPVLIAELESSGSGVEKALLVDARTRYLLGWGGNGRTQIVLIGLGIWHDTPVEFAADIQWAPYEFEVPARSGAQVAVGDFGRVQFVASVPDLHAAQLKQVNQHTFEAPRSSGAQGTLLRVFPTTLRESVEGFRPLQSGFVFHPEPVSGASMRLTMFRERARIWFHIPDLPEMPNGREVENLLDVRIPFARFEHAPLYNGLSVSRFVEYTEPALSLASGAMEFEDASSPLSDARFSEVEFENVTVRELLVKHRGKFEFDEERFSLNRSRERLSLWKRFQDWLDSF